MKQVLHILRRMDPGGIELWLLDLARAGGVDGWRMAVAVEEPGAFDQELVGLGATIHRWKPRRPFELLKLMRGFDAVHSHVHAFSGAVLMLAAMARVPVRIAHSHCCQSSAARPAYYALMRMLMALHATSRLAVSRQAAIALYGTAEGIATLPAARDMSLVPQAGLSRGETVLAHAGRFVPEKNHRFLLDLLRLDPALRIAVLGEGPAKREFLSAAGSRVIDTANRNELLRVGTCFVFPSLSEGLGLAAVEAQAAGMPCVFSDAVPEEAVVVPRLVKRLPLAAGAERWLEAVHAMARMLRDDKARDDKARDDKARDDRARDEVLGSHFHIPNNARALRAIYEASLTGRRSAAA